jgi:FkbM family methyltransferase
MNGTPGLGVVQRTRTFLQKPWNEKFGSFYARWRRAFPRVPVPVRLPFGGWFLARADHMGSALIYGGFEEAETAFVQKFLRAGMTVLDIGANQGFYTLLAAKCVGALGKVIAFEPSPRERKALRWNLRVNGCRNVVVEELALGNEPRETEKPLYVVQGAQTGCNSLEPPAEAGATSVMSVRVTSLDGYLAARQVKRVDFVKLDVEGAELSVLQGSRKLLEGRPRPVLLAEVQDIRTRPWNYAAREIIKYVGERGYGWFSIGASGELSPLDTTSEAFDGNFVAVPKELKS